MIRNIALIAGLALTLSACGEAKAPEAAPSEAAPAASAPATAASAPAAAASGGAPSKDFMVGKWGEEGGCDMALEFKADGSMVGPFERWELNGSDLTMVGNPQTIRLTVIDNDTMQSQVADSAPRKLKRC
jgi:hypothetical protein